MKHIFVQFKETLLQHGLEFFGRFYGVYRGSVYDNRDPEKLGRVRVMCPAVFGENKSPNMWVFPRGAMAGKKSGVFWVPPIGSPVYISFVNGDKKQPLYENGWWLRDAVPADARRENPNMYMLATPAGIMVQMDDENDTVTIKNAAGVQIQITPDGVQMQNAGGESMHAVMSDLLAQIKAITVNVAGMTSTVPVNMPEFELIEQRINQLFP